MRLRFGSVLLVICLVSACTSIVRKPEINAVRKVAVVSLFATRDVIFKHGPGKFDRWSTGTTERVAQGAHQAFETEMRKLKWETIPSSKVIASAAFQKYFGRTEMNADQNIMQKGLALAQRLNNMQYFTLPKMSPINWNEQLEKRSTASMDLSNFTIKADKPLNEQMQEVANDLGVDAVVAIQMDYCYGEGISVGGNGEAYILGQASMYAVDKQGVPVVKLPKIEKRCETDKYGGKSSNSIAVVSGSLALGNLLDNDKLVTMFNQASQQTASKIVKALDDAIHKD